MKQVLEKGIINSLEEANSIIQKYKEYEKNLLTHRCFFMNTKIMEITLDFEDGNFEIGEIVFDQSHMKLQRFYEYYPPNEFVLSELMAGSVVTRRERSFNKIKNLKVRYEVFHV